MVMVRTERKILAAISPAQRDEVVNKILRNYQLKTVDDPNTTVQRDRINRIRIFEGPTDNRILVQEITVVIVPITFSIEPLLEMTGDNTTFAIHLVLDKIENFMRQLKALASNPSVEHIKRNRVDLLLRLYGLDGDSSGAGKRA